MLDSCTPDHLRSHPSLETAHLGNLGVFSASLSETDFQKTEKLAIVYASPPLSPSAQQTAPYPSIATLKGRSAGMDNNDRRQRQSNPTGYAGQQGLVQTSQQYSAAGTSDRYRQPHLPVQSPSSAPSAARSGSLQEYNYPYSSETSQFAGSSMQYPAQYGQETQRPQQQYQQYGSNIMYNVPSQQQQAPQSPYEPVQPYPAQRQATAVEVLTNQFAGVPQQYYVPGQEGPSNTPSAAIATQSMQQYAPMSYTTQSPVGRDHLSSAYTTAMADPGQSASSAAAYGQTSYATAPSADMDTAYSQYETELRRTFESVRDGRLAEAGRAVINISDWLLSNAEVLGTLPVEVSGEDVRRLRLTTGLVRDDESMHAQRLKMWDEFNTCWLSVLQRQKEMTVEMLATGQRPELPQSLMDYDFMESMGKELVRLCDMMEKHGLVDYQMGVWEEEIINRGLSFHTCFIRRSDTDQIPVLTSCLDQLEDPSESPGNTNNLQASSSSSTQRRR